MSYATYKGQTFCSFNIEPTKFKTIEPNMFIELQLTAQCNLNNITWELKNAKTYKKYQTAAANGNRVSSINSSPW